MAAQTAAEAPQGEERYRTEDLLGVIEEQQRDLRAQEAKIAELKLTKERQRLLTVVVKMLLSTHMTVSEAHSVVCDSYLFKADSA